VPAISRANSPVLATVTGLCSTPKPGSALAKKVLSHCALRSRGAAGFYFWGGVGGRREIRSPCLG